MPALCGVPHLGPIRGPGRSQWMAAHRLLAMRPVCRYGDSLPGRLSSRYRWEAWAHTQNDWKEFGSKRLGGRPRPKTTMAGDALPMSERYVTLRAAMLETEEFGGADTGDQVFMLDTGGNYGSPPAGPRDSRGLGTARRGTAATTVRRRLPRRLHLGQVTSVGHRCIFP